MPTGPALILRYARPMSVAGRSRRRQCHRAPRVAVRHAGLPDAMTGTVPVRAMGSAPGHARAKKKAAALKTGAAAQKSTPSITPTPQPSAQPAQRQLHRTVVRSVPAVRAAPMVQAKAAGTPVLAGGTQTVSIAGPVKGVNRTLVFIPPAVRASRTARPVDVLLHFHGFGARASRYREHDRIAEGLVASGRRMIAVVPQYDFLFKWVVEQTPEGPKRKRRCFGDSLTKAGFTSDSYLTAVFEALHKRHNRGIAGLPESLTPGSVVLSGHSAAGRPISALLRHDAGIPKGAGGATSPLPSKMPALVLFDAINSDSQLAAVRGWVLAHLESDLAYLRRIAAPGRQLDYLRNSQYFLAYYNVHYTHGLSPEKQKAARPPKLYAGLHLKLAQAIKQWFTGKKCSL